MTTLFDLAEMDPPHNGTETSRQAAASVRPHVARLEAVVLEAIRERGGATCDEIEVCSGLSHQTASARCRALFQRGIIRDSGVKRRTRSQRLAIVWTVTEGERPV